MRDFKSYILFGLMTVFSLVISETHAQLDSLNLSPALVLSDSLIENIEELNSISDVLDLDPKIQLNSRGPSGLATLTMRGGNSSQVALRWNGMDVSSPLLGQSDASLLNPILFSDISVDSGSDNTSNGGISGDLNLTSRSDKRKGFFLQLGSGLTSFSNTLYNAKVHVGLANSSTTIKLFKNGGWNNYPIPLPDGTTKFQEHARINRSGILITQEFTLGKTNMVALNAWIQDSKVLLPPKIDQTRNTSSQNDSFTRLQAKYQKVWGVNTVSLSGAFSNELNHYIDPLYGYNDKNTFHRYQSNFSWKRKVKKTWDAAFYSSITNTVGRTPNYTEEKDRRVYAVESYLSKSGKRIFVEAIGGFTFLEKATHRSLRVKGNYYLKHRFSLYAQYYKNFRIPTFNDLYWFPIGNSDLETETSKSIEAGLNWKLRKSKISFLPQFEYYRRLTENWILWTLDSDVGFWSPYNITEVESEGVELTLPFMWKISENFKYNLNASGQLSKSVFTQPVNKPNIIKGEQVYYAPSQSFYLSNQFSIHNYTFKVELTHRGNTNGVNYEIQEYQKLDAGLARLFKTKKHSLEVELSVKNLFDQAYEVIERTPLPGRYIYLRINLKSKIK